MRIVKLYVLLKYDDQKISHQYNFSSTLQFFIK